MVGSAEVFGISDHPVRSKKGGFAASSLCRGHPSSTRRGLACSDISRWATSHIS